MTIDIATTIETTATVRVEGRLDALTAPGLREQFGFLLDDDVTRITVDLSDVPFVDSAGLAALISAMKSARTAGGDVELIRPRSDEAYRVFELTKFDAVFTIRRPD